MLSLRSRVFRLVLRYQTRRTDENASLQQRRAALEASARRLPMPRAIELRPTSIGAIAAEWLRPAEARDDRAILYLHGGAYTMGSCTSHRALAARIARAGKAPALHPEYRLAPEHPFPAALEDCVAAYRWLVGSGIPPQKTVVVGDSAGGGLALALAVALRDEALPLPAAIACMSPWADLALTGESCRTRATVDPICSVEESALHAARYVGSNDPRAARISPVYADLRGLPPLLIHAGDHEILLSDATRVAERARAAGVDVRLTVWPGMWHVWHLLAAYLPEAQQAIDDIGAFIGEHIS
jgi:monoterpene epsilon-lactone hydrolase